LASEKRMKGTPPNPKQEWRYFLKTHKNDLELIKEKYSVFCHLVVLFLNTKVSVKHRRPFPEYYFIRLFNTISKLSFVESFKQIVRSESITLDNDRFKSRTTNRLVEDLKDINELKRRFGNHSRMLIKNLEEYGKQIFLLDDNSIDRYVPNRQIDYCRGKMNGMKPYFEEQFDISSPRDYELALRVLLDKYNTLHERFILENREEQMEDENDEVKKRYQERAEEIPTRNFTEDEGKLVEVVFYTMPEFNEEVYERLKKLTWRREWKDKVTMEEFKLFQKRQQHEEWKNNKTIYRYYPTFTLAFIKATEPKWTSDQKLKFGREVNVMRKIEKLERMLHMFLNGIYMEKGGDNATMTSREFVAKSSLASKLRILRKEIKNFKRM